MQTFVEYEDGAEYGGDDGEYVDGEDWETVPSVDLLVNAMNASVFPLTTNKAKEMFRLHPDSEASRCINMFPGGADARNCLRSLIRKLYQARATEQT